MAKVRARWDMAAFDAAVRESQARRWVVYPALRNGAYYPWDFQPLQKASERYMRNHMDLERARREQTLSARRMMTILVPSLDHLRQAYAVTSKATQITPLLESAALARETGAARVFIKPESLQWAGSFKVRGAYWRLKQLSADEAKKGVVAYSSGNFAQGLAAAGQALGIPVTIVMPIDAPAAKRDATAGYGARSCSPTMASAPARKSPPPRRARSPRPKGWRCCIRSTIRRSSPARPAPGSKRSTSLRPRMPAPTCCSARSAAAG